MFKTLEEERRIDCIETASHFTSHFIKESEIIVKKEEFECDS